MKFIGIIPARYASTRFPAKPLAILGSKPVIQRVYEQVAGILAVSYTHLDVYKRQVMLRAVINEGTGGRVRRLYGITADMGGKTGTTNRNSCLLYTSRCV